MAPKVPTSIFEKTKICRFFNIGVCNKGKDCFFAHSKEELRKRPDLSCTKLCPVVASGGTCRDETCGFAHTSEERRKIGYIRPRKKASAQASAQKSTQKQESEEEPPQLGGEIQVVVRPQTMAAMYKPSASSNISTASTDDTDVMTVPWKNLCMTMSGAQDDDSDDDPLTPTQPSPRPMIAYVA
eukprot:TRINITY_DN47779_c0_g1_i1.p1 TRINITY_DN47779_c0_g1~~TRINITY_DN47779_c0_g1_i1.p1  ORF type:complete len:184 (+),score=30.85 TRINITY_DN47779_c0_g1_i1:92-643(+)